MARRQLAAVVTLVLTAGLLAVASPPASAAVITVTEIIDDDPLVDNGECSLREAIIAANTNLPVDSCPAGEAGLDIIVLQAGATYTLTIAGAGEDAAATGDLDILDAAAGPVRIQGNGATVDATGLGDRIFHILSGADVIMENLTITGGDAGTGDGGGILNVGTLTLQSSTITGNMADDGGGIGNSGTALLSNTTIDSNTAAGTDVFALGGGIYNAFGTLTISSSTISNNIATGGGDQLGGGLQNDFGGTLTVANSTITGNTSDNVGGGVHHHSGTSSFFNVTIAGNSAAGGNGILRFDGTVTLKNTIVYNPSPGTDCSGTITSDGHNIDSDGTCNLTQVTDQPNTNPLLGALADNGGDTQTHLPLAGSTAIDRGDNTACAAPPVDNVDQRGLPRPIDGNNDGTVICDIGSVEVQALTTTPTPTPTATPTPTDTPTPTATPEPAAAPVFTSDTPCGSTILAKPRLPISLKDPTVIDIGATDPNPTQTVHLSAIGLPGWASFNATPGNPAHGQLRLTPGYLDWIFGLLMPASEIGVLAMDSSTPPLSTTCTLWLDVALLAGKV